MRDLTIICVGKLRDKFYADASAEYIKRLSAFCSVRTEEVPAASLPEDPSPAETAAALRKEAEAIRRRLPRSADVIALCVEGKELTSEQFAQRLRPSPTGGKSGLAFIIGGSYGIDEELKKQADERISMSKMTFPHRLARVMLLEQIYRGFMIAEGRKYHK